MEDTQELIFCGRVLDNVHGFIYYTATEGAVKKQP